MKKPADRLIAQLEDRYSTQLRQRHDADLAAARNGGESDDDAADIAGPSLVAPDIEVTTVVTYFDARDFGTFDRAEHVTAILVRVTGTSDSTARSPDSEPQLTESEAEAWGRAVLGREWSRFAYFLLNSSGPWHSTRRLLALVDEQGRAMPASEDFYFAGIPFHSGAVTVRAISPEDTSGPLSPTIAPTRPAPSLTWPVDLTGNGQKELRPAAQALLDQLKIKGRIDRDFKLLSVRLEGPVAVIIFERQSTGDLRAERVTLPLPTDLHTSSEFGRRSVPPLLDPIESVEEWAGKVVALFWEHFRTGGLGMLYDGHYLTFGDRYSTENGEL